MSVQAELELPARQRLRNVAIVGATGAVGAELIGCLERRDFPVARLKLLASARSAGRTLMFKGQPLVVETLAADSFDGVDIALFSAGAAISRQFAPIAAIMAYLLFKERLGRLQIAGVAIIVVGVTSLTLLS